MRACEGAAHARLPGTVACDRPARVACDPGPQKLKLFGPSIWKIEVKPVRNPLRAARR